MSAPRARRSVFVAIIITVFCIKVTVAQVQTTELVEVSLNLFSLSAAGLQGFSYAQQPQPGYSPDHKYYCRWHSDGSTAGASLQIGPTVGTSANTAPAVVAVKLNTAYGGSTAQYRVQYSDDGLIWSNASGSFIPSKAGWNTKRWSKLGPHQYWRLLLENDPLPGPWIIDCGFYEEWESIPSNEITWSQSDLNAYSESSLLDEDLLTPAWNVDGASAGAYLRADLGRLAYVRRVDLYQIRQPEMIASNFGLQAPYRYEVQESDAESASDPNFGWRVNAFNQSGAVGIVVPNKQGWVSSPLQSLARHWRLQVNNTPLSNTAVGAVRWMTDGLTYREEPLGSAVLSQSGLTQFIAAGTVDNQLTTPGWHTDGASAGAWLRVDLGVPKLIVSAAAYATSTSTFGMSALYAVQYSDDGAAWYSTNPFSLLWPSQPGWTRIRWEPAGPHRYWQLRLYNAPAPASWLTELRFYTVETLSRVELSSLMFTSSGFTSYHVDELANGDEEIGAWHTDLSSAGAWLQIDLPTPQAIRQADVYAADSSSPYTASYSVQFSDDALAWTNVATGFAISRSGRNTRKWPNAGTHRYWRLVLENVPDLGPWLTEVELFAER